MSDFNQTFEEFLQSIPDLAARERMRWIALRIFRVAQTHTDLISRMLRNLTIIDADILARIIYATWDWDYNFHTNEFINIPSEKRPQSSVFDAPLRQSEKGTTALSLSKGLLNISATQSWSQNVSRRAISPSVVEAPSTFTQAQHRAGEEQPGRSDCKDPVSYDPANDPSIRREVDMDSDNEVLSSSSSLSSECSNKSISPHQRNKTRHVTVPKVPKYVRRSRSPREVKLIPKARLRRDSTNPVKEIQQRTSTHQRKCPVCNATFHDLDSLLNHRMTEHDEYISRRIPCRKIGCHRTFRTYVERSAHERKCHKQ